MAKIIGVEPVKLPVASKRLKTTVEIAPVEKTQVAVTPNAVRWQLAVDRFGGEIKGQLTLQRGELKDGKWIDDPRETAKASIPLPTSKYMTDALSGLFGIVSKFAGITDDATDCRLHLVQASILGELDCRMTIMLRTADGWESKAVSLNQYLAANAGDVQSVSDVMAAIDAAVEAEGVL